MSQLSFTDAEQAAKKKRTRRERFLEEMEKVIPWERLESTLQRHYQKPQGRGRPPYPLRTMLRIYCMQQWWGLSDPGMEDSLYEIASMRRFAGLDLQGGIPDETTILNFRHFLEKHNLTQKLFDQLNKYLQEKGLMLREGTIVDATIIAAPSSTKNSTGKRDPEMHQTKKGNQWHFGMKAHVGVDAASGLAHSLSGTAANVSDVTVADQLLHGEEKVVFGDSGYTGVEKREEHQGRSVDWLIAMKPSQLKRLWNRDPRTPLVHEMEYQKARIRSRVEQFFQIIKCVFGYRKTRYKGLEKNTSQLYMLCALANLHLTRKELLAG